MDSLFISYRWEGDGQKKRVRDFAETLRAQLEPRGVTVALDQFLVAEKPGGPDTPWPLWSANQVREASRVLIVGTPSWMDCFLGKAPPGEGAGAACEAHLVYQELYDSHWISAKFRVVLFDPQDARFIAGEIKGLHRFTAGTDNAAIVAWASPPVATASADSFPVIAPNIEWPLADCVAVREAVESVLCAESKHRIILVRGETNRGKSEICRVLRGLRAQFRWLRCGRFELQGTAGVGKALNKFIDDLDATPLLPASAITPHQRANALLAALHRSPQPTLLIFDAFDKAGEFGEWVEERVLSRVTEWDWLRVVVAGQRLPSYGTTQWGELAAPPVVLDLNTIEHWLEFGRRRKKDLPEQEIKTLYRVAGQDHRLMQSFVLTLCET